MEDEWWADVFGGSQGRRSHVVNSPRWRALHLTRVTLSCNLDLAVTIVDFNSNRSMSFTVYEANAPSLDTGILTSKLFFDL